MKGRFWFFLGLLFICRLAQGEFSHPGILINLKQLQYVQGKYIPRALEERL